MQLQRYVKGYGRSTAGALTAAGGLLMSGAQYASNYAGRHVEGKVRVNIRRRQRAV